MFIFRRNKNQSGYSDTGNFAAPADFPKRWKFAIIDKYRLQHEGEDEKMKEEQTKLNHRTALVFLNRFLDGLRFEFVLFYFGWLFDTLIGILTPVLFGIMINQIVYYRNLPLFIRIGALFFAVSVFSSILYYWIYKIYSDFWGQIISRVRFRIYQVIQKMEAEELSNSNYGDMLDLMQNKVYECVNFIVRNIIHNINNFLAIIVCFIIVVIINPWVGLLLFAIAPLSVFISWKFGKRVREERYQNQLRYGSYIGWLYEMFSSLKDIRLLGAEGRVMNLFHRQQKELMDSDVKAGITSLKSEHIIANVNTGIQMLLYAVLAYFSLKENLSIGSIVVVLTYFSELKRRFNKVSNTYMDAQYRLSVIGRIKEMIEKPTEEQWTGREEMFVKKGEISFEDLSFSFQQKEPVIKEFDLRIEPGQKIALVGESGCGKSTLAYLLLGFYKPSRGVIKIDGKNISEFSLESIHRNIGVVQQDVLIFDGTIRENIMIGNETATEEEMLAACRAAGVYDFVMELEDGFETVLGTRGRQLSGGQKQRISIARVYLKNPAILIFDEATSSLDNETEALIHDAWASVLKNRTAIIITHRQSAALLCDEVALMKNGRIVERGTPPWLEEHSEEYRILFALQ